MKDLPITMIPEGWMEKTGGYAKDMTLRDHFAAKAMQAMLASPELMVVVTADQVLGENAKQRISNLSYQYADVILKAREA